MAARFGKNDIHVITKDGEIQVTISLDININLNTGDVVGASIRSVKEKDPDPKEVEWAIPDFSESPKLNFGK